MPPHKPDQPKNEPISWPFKEYEKYDRSRNWYLATIIICAAILIYAIWNRNYLFAFIIIMFGIIMAIKHRFEPADILFEINHKGIQLGQKHYPYSELSNFWIIYEPPTVKNLYFSLKSGLNPELSIPLADQNPLKVKSFLRQYLEEDLDQENEPASEAISRLLKL